MTTSINEQVRIIITDITGHIVKEVQGITNDPLVVQLDDAAPGMYILYATTSKNTLSEKIIKTQ
jgi:hypothetical protein